VSEFAEPRRFTVYQGAQGCPLAEVLYMRSISPRWLVIACILVIWAALSLSAEPAAEGEVRMASDSGESIGIVE